MDKAEECDGICSKDPLEVVADRTRFNYYLASSHLGLACSGKTLQPISQIAVVMTIGSDNSFELIGADRPAPGRRIENKQLVFLPSGAVREFYEIVETRLEPPMTYATYRQVGIRPGLDCSCEPKFVQDIAECSNQDCLAVTCLRHSGTCLLCGRVYCSACLRLVNNCGTLACICVLCEKDIKTPKIIKALKKLIWG